MVEENARMIRALPATWRPVYLRGKSLMTLIKPRPFDQPTQWYLLWGRGFFSQFLAPDLSYPSRLSPEVWADFFELRVGPETKEFVRICLWNKLLVHSRVFVLSGTKVCPLCGAEETANHAPGGCRFYTAIKHVLSVYWSTGTQGVSTVDLFLSKNASLTMKTLSGVMVWLAREALWKYTWVVKEGAKVTLELLLSVWVEVLKAWLPRSGGGIWLSESKVFLAALTQFLKTRVLPPKAPDIQPILPCPTTPRTREALTVQVSPKKRKVQDKVLRCVEDKISEAIRTGCCLVYSDGSSKRTGSVSVPRVGGYGVYPPPRPPRTNRHCGWVVGAS